MEFKNYKLQSSQGVELSAYGHNWDLHNFADFLDFTHDPDDGTATLTWKCRAVENPWGDSSNTASGCTIQFEGVTRWDFRASGREEDGDTLAEVSDIPQCEEDWDELDQYDLWFRFENGDEIKVAAKATSLIPRGPEPD